MPRTSRVPKGRLKTLFASGCWMAGLSRAFGTDPLGSSNPALKRWAILIGPFGTSSHPNPGTRLHHSGRTLLALETEISFAPKGTATLEVRPPGQRTQTCV